MRIRGFILSICCIIMCLALASCDAAESVNLWESAMYTQDAEFGNGDKTVIVEVKAEEKVVTLTINTNCETVGEALSEHNLISGEDGAYGLYVKSVNGIIGDYAVDQSYWAFYKEGQYMQTGVDKTEFIDGDKFELVREEIE